MKNRPSGYAPVVVALSLVVSCASLDGLTHSTAADAGFLDPTEARDGGSAGSGTRRGDGDPPCQSRGSAAGPACSTGARSPPSIGAPSTSGTVSATGAGSDTGLDSSSVGDAASCMTPGLGTTSCGAHEESCCTSSEVTGGSYFRTYDLAGADGGPTRAPDGGPVREGDPATMSGFRLDRYLVTVGRFRQFVTAWNDGYLPAEGSGKHSHLNGGKGLSAAGGGYETGWSSSWNVSADLQPTTANLSCESPSATWTASVGSQESLPINCIDWYEAYAFCIWDGGFLPSEAEWEYAAAGGGEQRVYPWGDTPPGSGNAYAIYDGHYSSAATGIAPVGTATLGAGRWGQLDLAGEVVQWTADWYGDEYVNPCQDCADLTPASGRVFRGGCSLDPAAFLLATHRNYYWPSSRDNVIGFRCARTP